MFQYESGEGRRVHFGSLSDNETFVYGRSHHYGASLDLLIPRNTSSPLQLRSEDSIAKSSAANSVGNGTKESADDAADNASNDAADEHANTSSAILADGVVAAVLTEDHAEDTTDDVADDAADNPAGNAAVGRTTFTQPLRDPPSTVAV